ncbi:MAG: DUF4114 domain-containing protein [Pseudomonadota bacterium]|nr:DUF4114 domain-containing protein [Pseudomonadota bacterium]
MGHVPYRSLIAFGVAIAALMAIPTAQAAYPETLPGMTNEVVPQSVLDTVDNIFTEGVSPHPMFINPARDSNLYLTADSQVKVTFIIDTASLYNTIGYAAWQPNRFNSETHGSLDVNSANGVSWEELIAAGGIETGWVFPNASAVGSGGLLVTGDTVAIGGGKVFSADTRISFFLLQNGWDHGMDDIKGRQGFDPRDPQSFYTLDFLNPENDPSATIGNPSDMTRHTSVMFEDPLENGLIIGFEDLNRTDPTTNPSGFPSDEDFNDVVLRIQAPLGGDIPTAPVPLAGGGLAGLMVLGAALGMARQRRRTIAQ